MGHARCLKLSTTPLTHEDISLRENSTANNLLVSFVMQNDFYAKMKAQRRHIHAPMQALIDDGPVVGDRKYDVEVTLRGDKKLLSSMNARAYTVSAMTRSYTRQRMCGDHMVAFQCGPNTTII
jgi:hypothetical protein